MLLKGAGRPCDWKLNYPYPEVTCFSVSALDVVSLAAKEVRKNQSSEKRSAKLNFRAKLVNVHRLRNGKLRDKLQCVDPSKMNPREGKAFSFLKKKASFTGRRSPHRV